MTRNERILNDLTTIRESILEGRRTKDPAHLHIAVDTVRSLELDLQDPISKHDYIDALRTLYLAANLSDAARSEGRPSWMDGDECGVHCSHYDAIVRHMKLDEGWLEDGPTAPVSTKSRLEI
jgi:hypothetical protein